MDEDKRPTLTLRRKTEPDRTAQGHTAPVEHSEPALKTTRKKTVVVSAQPAWKVKKQALEEKSRAEQKANKAVLQAEKARLWSERQVREKAERQAAKRKPAPAPVYRKRMPLEDAIALLQACWPALVEEGRPQLLAVNIRPIMLEDIRRRSLDISTKKLKRCLAAITRSDVYLDAMTPGAWRRDIHGQKVANITADEAAFAMQRKAHEHARSVRREAAERKLAGQAPAAD